MPKMRKPGELLERCCYIVACKYGFGGFDAENGCGIPVGCRSFYCSRMPGSPLSGDCPSGNSPLIFKENSMTNEQIIQWAVDEGFAAAAMVEPSQIPFDPSFRPYCEENLCGQYGANHSCPPDCGSPEAMKQRLLAHKRAVVLQTIWEISDYSDSAAIKQAKSAHNAAELRLVKRLRQAGHNGVIVGASGCALCSPCRRKIGEACPFPDLQYSCMSAYCIFVKKLTDECGLEYNCGDGLLSFFGMYVFD